MSEPAAALQSPPPIEARVRSDDRARLVDVERDARRLLLGDVDDDDIGQFLLRDGARHRHADVAGAAYHCHFAIHAVPRLDSRRLRSLSRSIASAGYSQFLLKTLLKSTAATRPYRAHDPERFSGLHHRSATVTRPRTRVARSRDRAYTCSRDSRRLYLARDDADHAHQSDPVKIVVADDLPASALDLLRAEGWDVDARTGRAPEQLAADLADADAIVVRSATQSHAALIDAAPKLRVPSPAPAPASTTSTCRPRAPAASS